MAGSAATSWLLISIGRFPLAFSRPLTNQNLLHTNTVGVSCFLLAEYLALSGLRPQPWRGKLEYRTFAHFNTNGEIRQF
jgi:hypothetical protein